MQRNFTQLYLHCIWATWDRLPLTTPDIKDIVYAAIIKECQQLGCTVIAIGGIADHIHLLTSFTPTLTISELIGKAKGSSSHLITHEIKPNEFFKWQGGYGVFTVSQNNLDQIGNYIRNQPAHHNQKNLISQWEI
ncbi:transposase IS200-family protein [Crinalium epipsammum PCC 9333]|uniref:Transposase IS200-family protein n=1 Tax=Crinalium epipsammum PCC 9333 TaxID=1173022 RepID=K9VYI6_9CYAN|nr:IS200/IS605 family transposase [Crinalium epipsammum]AFZ13021.1 transposase IS200-family protein [Crinalium epipsammum PCC 9333]